MIEVEGLTKYYANDMAIEDVSFSVDKGEILGFLGPNGAGKTTTMRIMTCFLAPTRGTARIDGTDILEDSLTVRRNLGYLPENVPLYRDMDVTSYLHYCARLRGVAAGDREQRVRQSIKKARIEEVQDKIIAKCSKGFRQRIGIAQALVHDPPVLILDEPTVGLDPRQIIETRNLIKELAGAHTIVLSTHILPEVSMTCERVVIVNEGRVVAVDTPDRLNASLRHSDRTEVLLKSAPAEAASQLRDLPHVLSVEKASDSTEPGTRFVIESVLDHEVRTDLAAFVVNQGWGLLELHRRNLSLEDIFLSLTTEEEGVNT